MPGRRFWPLAWPWSASRERFYEACRFIGHAWACVHPASASSSAKTTEGTQEPRGCSEDRYAPARKSLTDGAAPAKIYRGGGRWYQMERGLFYMAGTERISDPAASAKADRMRNYRAWAWNSHAHRCARRAVQRGPVAGGVMLQVVAPSWCARLPHMNPRSTPRTFSRRFTKAPSKATES